MTLLIILTSRIQNGSMVPQGQITVIYVTPDLFATINTCKMDTYPYVNHKINCLSLQLYLLYLSNECCQLFKMYVVCVMLSVLMSMSKHSQDIPISLSLTPTMLSFGDRCNSDFLITVNGKWL